MTFNLLGIIFQASILNAEIPFFIVSCHLLMYNPKPETSDET